MHEIKITQSNIRTDVISEKNNKNNHSYFIKENGLKIEKQSHYTIIHFKDITDYNNYKQVQVELIKQLKEYIKIDKNDQILVIGLGNEKSTPDSLGPMTIDKVLVTRYLYMLGEIEEGYSNVCSFTPNVMGNTGIETSDLIKSVIDQTKVTKVIVIDSLRTNTLSHLIKTIQITDQGINPGSGIGNSRKEISKKNMNVEVIAIGVPTIIEYQTKDTSIMVTPTDIDYLIEKLSILIGDSLNIIFHKNYNRHIYR